MAEIDETFRRLLIEAVAEQRKKRVETLRKAFAARKATVSEILEALEIYEKKESK
ncbi:hypothetical protein EKD04_012930 [Chloroflexales bacterium ZM16-3]|nr:hypothetical protein [Chloroflexales bacterium ZM16-3]